MEKEKILDFVLSKFIVHGNLTVDELHEMHKFEFSRWHIGPEELQTIINELISRTMLFEKSAGSYAVNPLARNSSSLAEKIKETQQENATKKNNAIVRVITISLTIIFGSSTIYFNIKNNEKNTIIATLQKQVDSLTKLIRH